MVELKTDTELEAMREAGRVVARALQAVRAHAAVGVSLRELDAVAAEDHRGRAARAHRPVTGPMTT
jgi:methionyl aminopeptidase